ncbi:helix-hairpin-helix domain-containing protein [Achromobacter mucicolens]|uniref:ComEA family DNA-binding protein n=1 Tax=Achromobacter mucicolens TaxID=1389922 RepID=UPI00244B71A5|nr:helix-hairpin-helix domain-containing protein [Achromobacter mucicolens]MDG9966555.1 helix-hairpin-helix domain-containing protein [Achromobacter mucicolens]
MNPFVHSTVARHLPLAPWRRARPAGMHACPRAGQRALRQALGALLLSAGLGVAAPPAQAVDINQATAAQLEGLRGIGPRTADIIVRERERGGRFESLDDLTERVRGIGQKKAQALQAAGLTIGAAGAAPKSAAAAAPAARPAPGKAAAAKPAGASTAGGAPVPARAKP